MKLLLSLFLCSSLYGQTIISDYDDTFRISFSYNLNDTLKTYLKPTRYLSDYKVLFNEVWDQEKHFLSSSPSLLLRRIKKDLKSHNVEYDSFTARTPQYQFNPEYKVLKITELLLKSEEPILLIGDDIHGDETAYQELASKYPNKVAQIYIRNVRKGSHSSHRYNYSIDIALSEYQAGRLDLSQISLLVDRLLEIPVNQVNIDGYRCPILNLSKNQLAIINDLPGSLGERVSEIYAIYSRDCFKKKSFKF